MPGYIDAETMPIDELPGIWSPVQWELDEEERINELEAQATASLLWNVNAPEAILRLLLNETEIERAVVPPIGYDPDQQGEWNDDMLTFQFKRPMHLLKVEREPNFLYLEYEISGLGTWIMEIEPEKVNFYRA